MREAVEPDRLQWSDNAEEIRATQRFGPGRPAILADLWAVFTTVPAICTISGCARVENGRLKMCRSRQMTDKTHVFLVHLVSA